METAQELCFTIKRFMGSVGEAREEDLDRLRKWLGRNEHRFRCILEYHFAFDERTHLIQDCEKDRCMVNWIKVYKYINILGIKLSITVYPVILWDIPLAGAHHILYNAQFRYKKGWISKKEDILINGEDLRTYVSREFSRDGEYVAGRLQSEVIKLSDYIISTFFSDFVKCEGISEMMV